MRACIRVHMDLAPGDPNPWRAMQNQICKEYSRIPISLSADPDLDLAMWLSAAFSDPNQASDLHGQFPDLGAQAKRMQIRIRKTAVGSTSHAYKKYSSSRNILFSFCSTALFNWSEPLRRMKWTDFRERSGKGTYISFVPVHS